MVTNTIVRVKINFHCRVHHSFCNSSLDYLSRMLQHSILSKSRVYCDRPPLDRCKYLPLYQSKCSLETLYETLLSGKANQGHNSTTGYPRHHECTRTTQYTLIEEYVSSVLYILPFLDNLFYNQIRVMRVRLSVMSAAQVQYQGQCCTQKTC